MSGDIGGNWEFTKFRENFVPEWMCSGTYGSAGELETCSDSGTVYSEIGEISVERGGWAVKSSRRLVTTQKGCHTFTNLKWHKKM